MSFNARFSSSAPDSYLKPHIAIECFQGKLAMQPILKDITTLIQATLGSKCQHPTQKLQCVSLDETLAEKWVALTRRVANSEHKPRVSDKQLVRHLYDIHQLIQSGQLNNKYADIAQQIIQKDREQFKTINQAYHLTPITASLDAVKSLQGISWHKHWDVFLKEMVYQQHKPSFNEAYASLQQVTAQILAQHNATR